MFLEAYKCRIEIYASAQWRRVGTAASCGAPTLARITAVVRSIFQQGARLTHSSRVLVNAPGHPPSAAVQIAGLDSDLFRSIERRGDRNEFPNEITSKSGGRLLNRGGAIG